MAQWIANRTEISVDLVAHVLQAEMEYLQEQGVAAGEKLGPGTGVGDKLGPRGAPLVLRPSKRTMVLFLGICAAFIAVGAAITMEAKVRVGGFDFSGPVLGWVVIALSGLGAVVLGATLLPGASYLRLSPEGLEMRSLFRSKRLRWSDVRGFRPIPIPGRT